MPVRPKSYVYPGPHIHPIFEMNLPEGYLFELFKELLKKRVSPLDDLTLLAVLAPTINGRLTYMADDSILPLPETPKFSLREVIDSERDLFADLVQHFLRRSAISGVQPKLLADFTDKAALTTDEYIVKSFGPQYPDLCENEFFCLTAARLAGLEVAPFHLSRNRKLLILERFDTGKAGDKHTGFEEIGTLMGLTRDSKYSGSYERIAETVKTYASPEQRSRSLHQLYLNIVLSCLLRNGDAHLKNFGLLYNSGVSDVRLSPAYDLVTTRCYIHDDQPALTLRKCKMWWNKQVLTDFGVARCGLSPRQASRSYDSCAEAVAETAAQVERYLREVPAFQETGKWLLKAWNEGLLGGKA